MYTAIFQKIYLSDTSVQVKNDNICKIITIIVICLIAYDDNIAYVSYQKFCIHTYYMSI